MWGVWLFLHHLWKTLTFPLNWFCTFFWKLFVLMCVGLFLNFIFCSNDIAVCLCANVTLSCYCTFIVSQSGGVSHPIFFLILGKLFLLHSDLSISVWVLESVEQFLFKWCCLESDWNCIESIDQFEKNILPILSFLAHKQKPFHLFRLLISINMVLLFFSVHVFHIFYQICP
jgi:hypothetical protein